MASTRDNIIIDSILKQLEIWWNFSLNFLLNFHLCHIIKGCICWRVVSDSTKHFQLLLGKTRRTERFCDSAALFCKRELKHKRNRKMENWWLLLVERLDVKNTKQSQFGMESGCTSHIWVYVESLSATHGRIRKSPLWALKLRLSVHKGGTQWHQRHNLIYDPSLARFTKAFVSKVGLLFRRGTRLSHWSFDRVQWLWFRRPLINF